jgi:osmotically-inducible protein OsmY
VQLEGAVDAYWLKAYAEDVVLGLAGVASVKNELTIVPTHHWADESIADEIMAALRRRSLVEPSGVAVEVDSGRVALSGRVGSSTARQVVQELAMCTRGVREVENNLVVDA